MNISDLLSNSQKLIQTFIQSIEEKEIDIAYKLFPYIQNEIISNPSLLKDLELTDSLIYFIETTNSSFSSQLESLIIQYAPITSLTRYPSKCKQERIKEIEKQLKEYPESYIDYLIGFIEEGLFFELFNDDDIINALKLETSNLKDFISLLSQSDEGNNFFENNFEKYSKILSPSVVEYIWEFILPTKAKNRIQKLI